MTSTPDPIANDQFVFTALRADCRAQGWPTDHPYWTEIVLAPEHLTTEYMNSYSAWERATSDQNIKQMFSN